MACSKTIHAIKANCDGNLGGIRSVYIRPYAPNVFSISEDSADAIPQSISAVTSATTATTKWQKFEFEKNTAQFTSTLNVGEGGNYVSTEITMQFGRMQSAKRLSIASLCLSEVMVVVETTNGEYFGFGTDEGVTVSAATGATGAAKGDFNHYEITLLDEYKTWPLPLTDDAVEDVLADVVEA